MDTFLPASEKSRRHRAVHSFFVFSCAQSQRHAVKNSPEGHVTCTGRLSLSTDRKMHRNLAVCVSIHTYMHYIRTYGCVSTGYAYSYTKTQVIYLSLQHRKSTEAQRPHGAQELRAVSAFRTAPAAQSFTTYKVIMSLGMYMYVKVFFTHACIHVCVRTHV